MHADADLALDCRAALGEGALWDDETGVLYWVDILGHALNLFDPATGLNRRVPVGQPIGTVVPRRSGGVMVALRDGFASLDPGNGQVRMIAAPVNAA